MGTSQQEPTSASIAKLVAAMVFVLAVIGATAYLDDDSKWARAAGFVLTAGGIGLFALSFRRTLRENRGVRIPWIGRPQVSPRRFDVLLAVGGPLWAFGATVIGRTLPVPWYLPLVVVSFVVMVALATSIAVHNRRVEATSRGTRLV